MSRQKPEYFAPFAEILAEFIPHGVRFKVQYRNEWEGPMLFPDALNL